MFKNTRIREDKRNGYINIPQKNGAYTIIYEMYRIN